MALIWGLSDGFPKLSLPANNGEYTIRAFCSESSKKGADSVNDILDLNSGEIHPRFRIHDGDCGDRVTRSAQIDTGITCSMRYLFSNSRSTISSVASKAP